MAIAFSQNVTPWGGLGAGPQASGAFTPASGSTILVPMLDASGSARTLAYSGSINTPTAKISVNDVTNGNTIGMAEVLSATTGSQTITVNSTPTGDSVSGYAIVYTGVSSTGSYTSKPNPAATTVTGNAITVPAGSVLVGFCTDNTGALVSFTGQVSGGVTPTDRQMTNNGVVFYAISEWVGTGTSITPTWTASATSDAIVVQVLLTAGGSFQARLALMGMGA